MNNNMLQGLYDAAKSDVIDNATGLPKMDEQKLRRYLDSNTRLMMNNKDIFEEREPKFKSCPRYAPCPICNKCNNKASHLYVSCQTCRIPICTHTYENKETMIKRTNFITYVTQDVMNSIIELEKQIKGDANHA